MADETPHGDQPADSGGSRDSYTAMLRDLPRLRSIDPSDKEDGKTYVPPAPFISRMGGFAQGCGGVLLTVLGIPMVMAATLYGFYVWGPSLFLGAGLMLVLGTLGVWRGRRAPLLISLGIILMIAFMFSVWGSFIRPTALLGPIGGLAPYYELLVQIAALAVCQPVAGAPLLQGELAVRADGRGQGPPAGHVPLVHKESREGQQRLVGNGNADNAQHQQHEEPGTAVLGDPVCDCVHPGYRFPRVTLATSTPSSSYPSALKCTPSAAMYRSRPACITNVYKSFTFTPSRAQISRAAAL